MVGHPSDPSAGQQFRVDPGAGQAEVSPGAAICWLAEKSILSGLSFSNETGMTILPTTRVVLTSTDLRKKSAWHTVRAV